MKTLNGLIAWFVATLYVAYSFTLNTAAAVFSPRIQTALHISPVQANVTVTAFIVGFALMQIPAGYLLDRFRLRYVVTAGILVLAVGNLITAFANNLFLFTVSNFIQGVGAAFAFVAIGVLIGQWFKPKLFPILFGLAQTLSCVLSAILHYYFAVAMNVYSWNQLYFALCIFGFILVVLSFIFVKNPAGFSVSADLSLGKSLKKVIGNSQLWLCTIAAATSFGVLLAYAGFWYLRIQHYFGVDETDSLIISGAIFVGIGIGTPLSGLLSNIFKSRKGVIHVFLTLGVIVFLAGMFLPHFSLKTFAIIKVISLFIGILLSGSMLFYTIISEILPANVKGVALSVANTGVFLFNSFMMFIPYVFSTSVTYFTSLWILPAFIMVSILLLYFVKESYTPS